MVNAQEWLDKNYPKEERNFTFNLSIIDKNLTGELDLSDFVNLEWLDCSGNKLTALNLDNCLKLKELRCISNWLTNLDLTDLSQLKKLYCSGNRLRDLSAFSCLTNLEWLEIDNNYFIVSSLKPLQDLVKLQVLEIESTNINGSLEPLKNLTKLKMLNISDTNLDSGLEYLPESIRDFKCSVKCKKNSGVKNIYSLFANRERVIESGYGIKNFTQKLQQYKEIKDWIDFGVKLYDYEFIVWLKKTKKQEPNWMINYKEDYEVLKEKFEKYGLCPECKQLNTGERWCKDCNAKRFKKNFKKSWYENFLSSKWTSGNQEIDQFIQKYQLEATDKDKFIEWIPYEQFTDIEFLAQGGFGKVYKAKLNEGNISHWDAEKKQWAREKDYNSSGREYENYREVVLKSLNNSSNNTDFLDETAKHKIIDDWFNNIVPCYGLSQEPKTGNYLMVMKYIEGGNLRHYLNNKNLTFQDKLKRLTNIIQGLKDVHSKNLVHRDFHSGNILNSDIHSFITDLGLCKPTDEVNKEDEIFGVLPYVAPEVLRKKGYTPASDIYSLGILAYEIFANQSPYLDKEHDTLLAVEICQGLRPNLDGIKIPPMLKNLIKQCWDVNPQNRPTASEIERKLRNWQQDSSFRQQIQAIESEYNQMFQNAGYKCHPTASMNSKLINTKEITKILSESQSGQIYEQATGEQICLENTNNLDVYAININVEQNLETEQQAQIIHNPPKNN